MTTVNVPVPNLEPRPAKPSIFAEIPENKAFSGINEVSGIVRPDSGISFPASGISCPAFGIVRPASGIACPDSGIACPDSGITRHDSGISRPDSGIVRPDFRHACRRSGRMRPDWRRVSRDGSFSKPHARIARLASVRVGTNAVPVGLTCRSAGPAARRLRPRTHF